MKKLIASMFALTVWLFSFSAQALTYSTSGADLLLIFRQEGFNDVEFDLGSVSNFFNLAAGTVKPVGNWDLNLVLSNYNGSLSGVDFVLVASTPFSAGSPTAASWLTDADPSSNPTFVTGSQLSRQYSLISMVGTNAALLTGNNSVQSLADPESDPDSYDYVVSDNGQFDVTTLGGTAAFLVEQSIPGTSRFFQIQASSSVPKPPAIQIGSFSVDQSGDLTFTAGAVAPPPPQPVLSISQSGGVNTIAFGTASGATYQLLYSSDVTLPLSKWTPAGSPITGNGSTMSLQDAAASTRFYTVEAH